MSFQFYGNENRVYIETCNRAERMPIYFDGESIAGKIGITLKQGQKMEHKGIKVEFIGDIEYYPEKSNSHHNEFLSLSQQLTGPSELNQPLTVFEFDFKSVEKPYESFTGTIVKLRYYVRVTIIKTLKNMIKEQSIWVLAFPNVAQFNHSIKMEVGIEDCLHLEFQYNKALYHLKDVIYGHVNFYLIRVKITQGEISLTRLETIGSGSKQINETTVLAKYEIMDGAPGKGDSIPIRIYLRGLELSPTFPDINKKFSVKYFLNLILFDEDRRRYFKQQEIILYRKPESRVSR